MLDLVQDEVPRLSLARHPSRSPQEARDREPLGEMLVRVPIVMLGNRFRSDVERQQHGSGSEQGIDAQTSSVTNRARTLAPATTRLPTETGRENRRGPALPGLT